MVITSGKSSIPFNCSGGLTYDWMTFPANSQTAPISNEEQTARQLSPKAGMIWRPTGETTVCLAYSRSMGGTSVDQSYQLEPSQMAGFVQSFSQFDSRIQAAA